MVISCPHCGKEVVVPDPTPVVALSVDCPACGSRLDVAVVDPSATVPLGSGTSILAAGSPTPGDRPVRTVPQASLVVLGTDPDRERFALTARVTTVGRQAADIVIADEAISSCHFEIETRTGGFFIHDRDSSNGTFVNGERVRSAQLATGDTIRAGHTTLAFTVVDAIALETKD